MTRLYFILALLSRCTLSWSLHQPSISRRRLLESSLIIGGGAWGTLASPALAARGAAELDFEFYMRDLFGGNKKEGNIEASLPAVVDPPRILKGPLVSMLLDDDCSPVCVPVQALIEQIQKRTGGQDEKAIALDIKNRVQDLRERSSRGFRARAPWREETVSDQYYFDFTAYALWRTAAELLPDYKDRDQFVRRSGQMLYEKLVAEKLVRPVKGEKGSELVNVIPSSMEVLEIFKSSGFCKNYRIRGDDSKDETDPVFDELDDESLASGSNVDCLVSIFEPATLGASLQITGEQSRFGPDFVGTTLAALWDTVGVRSSWETFFVDPTYRPNPKDYFPNEQLVQFTLTSKR